MPALGVVVPFLNEERTAGPIARRLRDELHGAGIDFQLALVADGSTDGTRTALEDVARDDARVQVLCGDRAEGYGAAILHGFSVLSADIVGWTDGDGQVPPQTVAGLYQAMAKEGATFGMGLREGRKDGWVRAMASRGYNWTMRRALGFAFQDINAKPKFIHRDLLHAIAPTSRDWFIDTEVVVGAHVRGARVVRTPVPFLAREHGISKVKLSVVREYVRNLRAYRRRMATEPVTAAPLPSTTPPHPARAPADDA